LVDNHRCSLLQLLLTFHGLVLSALIFRPDIQLLLAKRQGLAIWLGLGVATVGFSLFGAFFSQHLYMRIYKKWIAVLESHLHRITVPSAAAHRGTLSWDDNQPYVPKDEGTVALLLFLFCALNIGVPAAVATLLGAADTDVVTMAFAILLVHFLAIKVLARSPRQTPGMVIATIATSTSDPMGPPPTHYKGNAITDSASHRGWFVGPFMTDRNPLLQTNGVEVKWGIHSAGQARDKWDAGGSNHSLTILLHGHLVQEFSDATYELIHEGDFVIWRPHVPHTWRVEQDSRVLTIRWGLTAA